VSEGSLSDDDEEERDEEYDDDDETDSSSSRSRRANSVGINAMICAQSTISAKSLNNFR